jgi:glycosyltransferase involved in cell wall biosynthesis
LVDGKPSGAPIAVVSPGGGTSAYWWATLELGPVSTPTELVLALRVDGREKTQMLEIGRLEAEPGTTPAGSPQSNGRLRAAIATTGAGPLVAICMATYEPPIDLFAEQVGSIKGQTHPDWVCLISDDGTSPQRLSAMREVVGSDPRFVWLENEGRLGFYGNYERALAAVPHEAEFVALADQDDRWYPEKLEALLRGIGDHDLVYGDMRVVSDDGSVLSETFWNRRRNNYTDLASMLVGNTVTGAASLFRARLLERALPFPPRRGDAYHDHWIALTGLTGQGLAYVDRPLQDYIQHDQAAQGHEEANAGARYLQPWLVTVLSWQAIRALLGGRAGEGWADRYFGMYTQTLMWARLLLMRSSGSLTAGQRRVLERVIDARRSPAALAWLAGRSLRPLWGANEAFGRELIVLSSIIWQWALEVRSRSLRRVR